MFISFYYNLLLFVLLYIVLFCACGLSLLNEMVIELYLQSPAPACNCFFPSPDRYCQGGAVESPRILTWCCCLRTRTSPPPPLCSRLFIMLWPVKFSHIHVWCNTLRGNKDTHHVPVFQDETLQSRLFLTPGLSLSGCQIVLDSGFHSDGSSADWIHGWYFVWNYMWSYVLTQNISLSKILWSVLCNIFISTDFVKTS